MRNSSLERSILIKQQNKKASNKDNIRPGKVWYIVALIVFLVGVGGGAGIFLTTIFSSIFDGTQFIVPGAITVSIDEPGKYTLWNETSTIFDGQIYSSSTELPKDLKIEIYEISSGHPIKLKPSWTSSETSGSRKRWSLGNIRFDKASEYKIEVTGDFSDRVFLLRRSVLSNILIAVVISSLLGILGAVGGSALAIIVFVKRSSARMRDEQQSIESKREPEQEGKTAAKIEPGQEVMWAMFCHLGALLGYIVPFGNIIAPLIIWLTKKGDSLLIEDQGKESLNFQISMSIYYLVSFLLTLIIVGFILLFGLAIYNLVMVIIAGVKANNGEKYRYPLTIRFIS